MSFIEKFKKAPDWEKEINGFLKDNASAQSDIDCRFADDTCYLSFVKGNNNHLYSIVAQAENDSQSVKFYVYRYKYDNVERLKEIALEIVENQKRIESGLDPDGYVSPEQIITEIGCNTVPIKEAKHFLNKVVEGTGYLKNSVLKSMDTVNCFSDDLHIAAHKMIMLDLGESTEIEDYKGYTFWVENNEKTRTDKFSLIITKNGFPIGSLLTDKGSIVDILHQFDEGEVEITRSTSFMPLKKPATISQIEGFDTSERILWQVQNNLDINETQTFESKRYVTLITADEDGCELKLNFSDDEIVPEDFRGFELYYNFSDTFNYNALLKEVKRIEQETLEVSVANIIDKAGDIYKSNPQSPISMRKIMNAFEAIGVKPMGKTTLHELNVVMGNLYNDKESVIEYRQLENAQIKALEKKNKDKS